MQEERNTRGGLSNSIENGAVDSVQEVARQVHGELRQLLQQRTEVMRRIGTVKRTIAGLTTLFGDSGLGEDLQELIDGGNRGRRTGFTKTCRAILMDADRALSVREIHDQLRARTPALLAGHQDPIASLTTVLNRLVSYGEAHRVVLGDGKRGWQWAAEPGNQSSDLKSEPH